MSKKEIQIGGQAVIEGVMMRGPDYIATAVRRKDDTIEVHREKFQSITRKKRILALPVIRGFVSLVEMLIIGFKSLSFSVSRYEMDNEDKNRQIKKSDSREKFQEILSFVLAFGLAFLLFAYLPYQLTEWLRLSKGNLYFNLLAGSIRIIFFIVYIWLISKLKDINRIFQYHGAEHKSVYAYENGCRLVPGEIQRFTTRHPRCGTSFIFLVLLISIAVFSIVDTLVTAFWGYPQVFVRLGYHLLLIPLISGLSYELLKLSSRNINHPLVKVITAPGLILQKITTQPPDDKQVEVAVIAMQCALEIEPAAQEKIKYL